MTSRPELYCRKIVVVAPGGGHRIYLENPPRPFNRLKADDLLDTADLCRIFDCSIRTIYRWIKEEGLRWEMKVGGEWLFRKDDVVDFYHDGLPRLGRPPRRGR